MKSFLKALLIGYLALVAGLYVFQRHLLYLPPSEISQPFEGVQVVQAATDDRQVIHGWFLAPPRKDAPVVVFFHGNASIFQYRAAWAKDFAAHGYGVLLVGYRGYDGEAGSPSEQGLYADARAQVGWLQAQGYTNLILHGESLGTGIAVQMATEFPARAVILESPYASMVDVAAAHYPIVPVRWLLKDRYDSVHKIAQSHAPLLIVHGTEDTTVPPSSAQKLFEAAQEPKEIHWLQGADHNTIYRHGAGREIGAFLERLTQQK